MATKIQNLLAEGDRNTRFFHQKATWRSKKNKIRRLLSEDNRYIENKEEMEAVASNFFQELYKKDVSVDPMSISHMFDNRLTQDMNDMLCKPFTDEEISETLFQIGPLKAPGPDGFPARFFQRNWGVLRDEVIGAVRNFFEEGVMPEGANVTAIVLIPKKDQAESLKDFRPINMCNVTYKIVSKCMANRLRSILHVGVNIKM